MELTILGLIFLIILGVCFLVIIIQLLFIAKDKITKTSEEMENKKDTWFNYLSFFCSIIFMILSMIFFVDYACSPIHKIKDYEKQLFLYQNNLIQLEEDDINDFNEAIYNLKNSSEAAFLFQLSEIQKDKIDKLVYITILNTEE